MLSGAASPRFHEPIREEQSLPLILSRSQSANLEEAMVNWNHVRPKDPHGRRVWVDHRGYAAIRRLPRQLHGYERTVLKPLAPDI